MTSARFLLMSVCRFCYRSIRWLDLRWVHRWNMAEGCGLGRTTMAEPIEVEI